jgi:uroporphyrinogen decarboxylase
LQPIRRYGFDAAILFADILLIPDALGADLWFVTGEGPRLSTITGPEGLKPLKGKDDIHDHLAPVYETVRILSRELPKETTLIGFAGAPWTVATYMIAGRGTPDQAPAHKLRQDDPETFGALIDLLTEATIEYLDHAGESRGRGREDLRQLGWIAQGRGVRSLRARTRANGSRPS